MMLAFFTSSRSAFSSVALLVWQQEGHPACKNATIAISVVHLETSGEHLLTHLNLSFVCVHNIELQSVELFFHSSVL